MHPDLKIRHRVLVKTYQSYLAADRAWVKASREAQAWLPRRSRLATAAIGNPGSRIREIYEQRDKALQRLVAARLKLQEGQRRILRRSSRSPRIVLLTMH